MPDPRVKVPANLIPIIEVAAGNDVPFPVLAAVLQQHSQWSDINAPLIMEVADGLRETYNRIETPSVQPGNQQSLLDAWLVAAGAWGGGQYPTRYRNVLAGLLDYRPGDTVDSLDSLWTWKEDTKLPTGTYTEAKFPGGIGGLRIVQSTAPSTTGENKPATLTDIYTLFNEYLGRPPKSDAEAIGWGRLGKTIGSLRRDLEAQPEAQQWRVNEQKIGAARGWVNGAYQRLLGRTPTNDEVLRITEYGWNPQQLESYLRQQPYGTTDKTIGAAYDLRTAMQKAAQDVLGRDATDGEINFAVTNGIPPKDAGAFFEQVRDGTVWAKNPDTYRNARSLVQSALKNFGITVRPEDIDPKLVNDAVTGKWTDEQIQEKVAAGQMPNAPMGVTVGQYSDTRQLATRIWQSYFPGKSLTSPQALSFVGLSPEQIDQTIRAMPSEDALAKGRVIGVGAYQDAQKAAVSSLSRLGVVGRDPTVDEIAQFVGKDVEAIQRHYETDPAIVAAQPGAPYGLTREAYYKTRQAAERAYSERFGATATLPAVEAKAAAPTPGGTPPAAPWVDALFQEGFTPQETVATFDDYFKRLGRAPEPTEIEQVRTKMRERFNDDSEIRRSNSAAYTVGPGGTAASLAAPRIGRR